MRLIAGVLKGKRLQPPGPLTRPTSDRAREMLFNILIHGNFWESGWSTLRVLDVCAGTGALGFEALSRGAAAVTLIEKDPLAIKNLKKTIASLPSFLPKPLLLTHSALDLPPAPHPFDLAFLDPPYGHNLVPEILSHLHQKGWVGPQTFIVTETSREEDLVLPEGFEGHSTKNCGVARFSFLKWRGPPA